MGSLTAGLQAWPKRKSDVLAGLLLPPQLDSLSPSPQLPTPRLLLVTRSTVLTRIFSHLITVSIPIFIPVGLSHPDRPVLFAFLGGAFKVIRFSRDSSLNLTQHMGLLARSQAYPQIIPVP